jgi:hypothetical protein
MAEPHSLNESVDEELWQGLELEQKARTMRRRSSADRDASHAEHDFWQFRIADGIRLTGDEPDGCKRRLVAHSDWLWRRGMPWRGELSNQINSPNV